MAAHFLGRYNDVLDVPLVNTGLKVGEVQGLLLLAGAAGSHYLPEQESRKHNHQPKNYRFYRRIHSGLL